MRNATIAKCLVFTFLGVWSGFAAPQASNSVTRACGPSDSGGSIGDMDMLWETDNGRKIKLGELNGRVRVISMFYATCQGVCLITKQDMQALEASLSPEARERVGFILVTLDARRDTAQALRSYRREEGLSPARWTLLRGDDAATRKLAGWLGVSSGRDASGRFNHSSELIVLDESGRIIHRHHGLRADLGRIAREIETAALRKTLAQRQPPAAFDQPHPLSSDILR
jgi:protein SCO1/2